MQQFQISVAPMMDWTDRHCRYFHRLLSPHAVLYTEMVTTGAILHGDRDRFLKFNSSEHPLVLQLGGSDPADLASCAKYGEDYGYDEINLNCGCPSDRVQKGMIGACLMAEPDLVAECVAAMRAAVKIPITVKCRIGINRSVDDDSDMKFLRAFIDKVSAAGCRTFIIHARKAWLKGLSPKENREVPPLRYDMAADIKNLYPHLTIILNGGLKTYEDFAPYIGQLDGAMIGREAYQNPYFLAELENRLRTTPLPSRAHIASRMAEYIESQKPLGVPAHSVTRHMLGLYNGLRGAKYWRQQLGAPSINTATTAEILAILNEIEARQPEKAVAA